MNDLDIKKPNPSYDVVVVGGGAAGLNGALILARSRRSVLVIDGGSPRNAPAAAIHGLIGREGMPPTQLVARGRREVESYGGHVLDGEVVTIAGQRGQFSLALADGNLVDARRLLITSGVRDELPDIPGLAERWGRDVLHCPYCHGWEVRGQALGVVATDARALHQVHLMRQLSDDVTLLIHGALDLSPEDQERLDARGIRVVRGPIARVTVRDDRLRGVTLTDGSAVDLDALVVAPTARPTGSFLDGIGLRPVPHPSGFGTHVPTEFGGVTAVPGVWAAGNVTDLMMQVGYVAAAGALAAAQLNADLCEEDTSAAVALHREALATTGP